VWPAGQGRSGRQQGECWAALASVLAGSQLGCARFLGVLCAVVGSIIAARCSSTLPQNSMSVPQARATLLLTPPPVPTAAAPAGRHLWQPGCRLLPRCRCGLHDAPVQDERARDGRHRLQVHMLGGVGLGAAQLVWLLVCAQASPWSVLQMQHVHALTPGSLAASFVSLQQTQRNQHVCLLLLLRAAALALMTSCPERSCCRPSQQHCRRATRACRWVQLGVVVVGVAVTGEGGGGLPA
jgi:hypothetical protein